MSRRHMSVTRNDATYTQVVVFVCSNLPVMSTSGFGVINSECVEDAFRSVDRRFFVPQVRLRLC